MNETEKREKIISRLFNYFNKDLFESIYLTGSMVFGRNFCIRNDSDIDVHFVLDSKNIRKIMQHEFFRGEYINENGISAFENSMVDGYFNDYYIDNVQINMGIWNKEFIDKFCKQEINEVKFFKPKLPCSRIILDLNGNSIKQYSTTEFNADFISKSLFFVNNILVRNPLYHNLLFSTILYDKNNQLASNITLLTNILKEKYTIDELNYLFEITLNKCPEDYKKKFLEKIKK